MADPGPKVSQLAELDEPGDTDLIYIARSGVGQYKQYLRDITGWASYYIEASEADQGDTGDGKSIKAYADTVGTTKNCIFRFIRGSGDTTDYTVTTNIDLSTYTNITFEFERGAELTGAGDIIFPSPSNIIAQPDQQIFSGTGTVSFANPGIGHPGWLGADATGTAESATALNALSTALPDGSTIELIAGSTYDLNTTTWTTTKEISIRGSNTQINYGGTGTAVFVGAASTAYLYRIRLEGFHIVIDSTDWVNTTKGLYLRNLYESHIDVGVEGFKYGIWCEGDAVGFVYNTIIPRRLMNNRFSIYANIENVGWTNQNTIVGGRIHVGYSTGLSSRLNKATVSFAEVDSSINDSEGALDFTTLFEADDFIIVNGSTSNDRVYKVSSVAASKIIITETMITGKATPIIDEAAGASISIYETSIGFWLPQGDGWGLYNPSFEASVQSFIPFVIEGLRNYVYGGRTEITGTEYAYISGTFNDVKCHWLEQDNVTIAGYYNRFQGYTGDYQSLFDGNKEIGFKTASKQINVWNENDYSGNSILKSYNDNRKTVNYYDLGILGDSTWYSGAGTYISRFRCRAKATTTIATSGTGNDDLRSLTLSAGEVGAYDSFLIKANGIKTGANGNKTISLVIGATGYTFNAAANDTNDWMLEAEVYNVNNATIRVNFRGYNGTTLIQDHATQTIDLSAGTTIKIVGNCADAGDVITQTEWLVYFM